MASARFLLFGCCVVLGACSPDAGQKDPVAEAKFQNEKRIGDAAVTERQERDAEFIVNAAGSGMLELEMSKLAQQKSVTPVVRNLAQRLVQQHGQVSTALRNLAQQKNLMLPSGLGSDQQKQYADLSALTGTQFDKRYVEMLQEAHKNDVDAFEEMSKDAYDGDIRGFAAKFLPTLEQHLEEVGTVADQLEDLP
jgi:putative membrane protein